MKFTNKEITEIMKEADKKLTIEHQSACYIEAIAKMMYNKEVGKR